MTIDEMEEIARKAQAKNPGPWRAERADDGVSSITDSSPRPEHYEEHWTWIGERVVVGDGGYYPPHGPTVDHIATFSPDVVLKLLARTKVAEAATQYLFNAWAGAEGDGQPTRAVFGDSDMDPEYARCGASEDIQALVRRLCKP